MLIATPTQGSIQRNPNWVSTKPAPNPNVEMTPKRIAVGMGALPHKSRLRSNVLRREIPDNAEVANRDFGKD